MIDLARYREKFTRWYVRKQWTFDGEGFDCPWYVRPLLFLFSPSVYYVEVMKRFAEGLRLAVLDVGDQFSKAVIDATEAIKELADVIKLAETAEEET